MDARPRHVAIIMDGNGRWARRRGLPRAAGHRMGVRSVRAVVRRCRQLGIRVLTLYAFSAENWSRPKAEVDTLMNYLTEYLVKERDEMRRQAIRLTAIGRLDALPEKVRRELRSAMDETRDNAGMTLVLALSYGGRSEIADAARRIGQDVRDGRLDPDGIDETRFENYLYTAGLPDPDLLIRTSGEQRVSNFLLWQISYAEIYTTNTCWPDFGAKGLDQAIKAFGKRQRRFGGVLN